MKTIPNEIKDQVEAIEAMGENETYIWDNITHLYELATSRQGQHPLVRAAAKKKYNVLVDKANQGLPKNIWNRL